MDGNAIARDAVLKSVKALDADDPAVIEPLVALYSAMVFRISYSILRNYHDAEDASQDCFLRVLKQGSRLGRVRDPKTWIARVAWTAALDRRASRHSSEQEIVDQEFLSRIPDPGLGPETVAADAEMQRTFERLVAALPEELRSPLELSTVQELNSREIAEIMNMPEGSVRTRLMRARQMLKDKLRAVMEVSNHE
jgi:RNA polymerase sigma-70 factor (ECF subfamily)